MTASSPLIHEGELLMAEYSYMVIPYQKNGTLLDYVNKTMAFLGRPSPRLQQSISSQVVRAVYHMHSEQNLAHRDIKPDNIVFTDLHTTALIDFAHCLNI